MKKITLALAVGILTASLASSPVFSQTTNLAPSSGDPGNNNSNPSNGGGSYGTGDNGSNNSSGVHNSASNGPSSDYTQGNTVTSPPTPSTSSGGTEADRGQGASTVNTASDGSNDTRVNGGKGNGNSASPEHPYIYAPGSNHPMTPPGTYTSKDRLPPSTASTLPPNSTVPPVVDSANLPPSGNSTLPPNSTVPPIKDPAHLPPSGNSTLPPNSTVPPAADAAHLPPSGNSTLPPNSTVPPVVDAAHLPPSGHSTLPDNGGAGHLLVPENPEGAPTNPPTVPPQ